jgi:intracellular septation protein
MKFLFDFFPAILFYIVYKYSGDFTSLYQTAIPETQGMVNGVFVMILATILQLAYNWFRHNKIEKMHVVTLVLVVVFGGITIYLEDPVYLFWKVSIINWLFALVFAGSHFFGEHTIIKRMMSHAITLPDKIWTRLSIMWILFFSVVGFINLAVAYSVNFDSWMDFKLFGLMGMTISFIIIQAIYLSRHAQEQLEKAPEEQSKS